MRCISIAVHCRLLLHKLPHGNYTITSVPLAQWASIVLQLVHIWILSIHIVPDLHKEQGLVSEQAPAQACCAQASHNGKLWNLNLHQQGLMAAHLCQHHCLPHGLCWPGDCV